MCECFPNRPVTGRNMYPLSNQEKKNTETDPRNQDATLYFSSEQHRTEQGDARYPGLVGNSEEVVSQKIQMFLHSSGEESPNRRLPESRENEERVHKT